MKTYCVRAALAAMLAVSLHLTGCGPVIAVPGAASEDAPAEIKDDAAYQFGPGDVIKLTVYGEDVLTGSYTVDQRGLINVPLIDSVRAAGLSRQALQEDIVTELVKGGYLSKPTVTVDVITMRPFYILGEVKNSGSYQWMPSMDVFKAIAAAGGYTPRAAKNMILIDRGEGEKRQHLNATENTPVLPGDSITVRERIF